MGAFHSTKTFENLETAANGTEISWKSVQKFRKLFNFRNTNHSTENVINSGSKVEWKENFREIFFRKFGYTSRGCPLFLEMSENRHYRCSQPKMLFHSLLEVAGNSNRKVWLNGKCPITMTLLQSSAHALLVIRGLGSPRPRQLPSPPSSTTEMMLAFLWEK